MKPILAFLQPRWLGLTHRERTLVKAALWVLLVFVIWTIAVQPALQTLRVAPDQRQQARATLERLQGWAAEAARLRTQAAAAGAAQEPVRRPDGGIDDATRALLIQALGPDTTIEARGREVTLSFRGASGEQVRQALNTVRSRLRADLIETELVPSGEGLRGRLRFEWTAG
ncbi:MAG: hypothetical protein RIR43_77 [Pseudomonadota bacterium]|jgi:general secretion pathway protein M